jgi:hypothetical protein
MREELLALVEACFEEQFNKGWDAALVAALEIIVQGVERGASLDSIRERFVRELEMKEDE